MWQESKKVIFLCIWKLWTCSHRSTCSKSRDAEKSWSSSGTKSSLFLLCFALRVIFCTIFISRKDCSTLYMIQQWYNLVYWNCFLLVLLEYLIGEIKKVPWQLHLQYIYNHVAFVLENWLQEILCFLCTFVSLERLLYAVVLFDSTTWKSNLCHSVLHN